MRFPTKRESAGQHAKGSISHGEEYFFDPFRKLASLIVASSVAQVQGHFPGILSENLQRPGKAALENQPWESLFLWGGLQRFIRLSLLGTCYVVVEKENWQNHPLFDFPSRWANNNLLFTAQISSQKTMQAAANLYAAAEQDALEEHNEDRASDFAELGGLLQIALEPNKASVLRNLLYFLPGLPCLDSILIWRGLSISQIVVKREPRGKLA